MAEKLQKIRRPSNGGSGSIEDLPTKKRRGEYASLIENGARLDREIKTRKEELDSIKEQMKEWGPGKFYSNVTDDLVIIQYTDNYTEADPYKVYKWIKENLSRKDFFKIVKVQAGEAKKLLGEVIFDKFRKKTNNPTIRISFK